MSYVSLFKNIPEFFGQPIGIAALASVGIHGAIAFILPLMPVDSAKPKQSTTAKPVGLVQLTPQEQSRLAQVNPSQVTLQPQIPIQPQTGLPGFANQPTPLGIPLQPYSNQLSLSPLSKSSQKIGVSSYPKGQSVRIIPSQNYQIDPSFNAKNERFQASRNFSNYKIAKSMPLVDSDITSPSRQPVIPPGSRRVLVEPASLPNNLPNNPPPVSSDTTPLSSSRVPIANIGTTPTNDSQNQDFTNTLAQNPQAGNLNLASQPLPPFRPGENLSPTNATSNTVNLPSTNNIRPSITNLAQQFSKAKQDYPNLQTGSKPINAVIPKPGIDGNAQGSFVVDSDGKIVSLDFLDNTVSPKVKNATREYLRDYFSQNPIKKHGKPQYNSFNLSFIPNGNDSHNSLPNNQRPSEQLQPNKNSSLLLPQSPVKPSLQSLPVNTYQGVPTTTPVNQIPIIKPSSQSLPVNPYKGMPATTPVNKNLTGLQDPQNAPTVSPKIENSTPVSTSSNKSSEKLTQVLRKYRDQQQTSN